MTDNELLELSAKAAGIDQLDYRRGSDAYYYDDPETGREQWDPLSDDRQAMRLASIMGFRERLAIEIHIVNPFDGETGPYTWIFAEKFGEFTQFHGKDPSAATRRAIVEAGATIGKEMR